MKRKFWWIVEVLLGVGTLLLGWYCFIRVSSDAIQHGEKFELQWYQWRFPRGDDIVKISSDGNAEIMVGGGYGSKKFFRKRLIVDDKHMADLVRNLNSLGVMALEDVYRTNDVDGKVWYLFLRTNERTKSIYCGNRFPAQLKALRKFMDETIVNPIAESIPPEPISAKEFSDYRSAITRNVRVR